MCLKKTTKQHWMKMYGFIQSSDTGKSIKIQMKIADFPRHK